MTDGELDEAVATRVMGWVRHHRNTAHWMKAGDDAVSYRVQAVVGDWRPSRDIAAAWLVMEHFSGPAHDRRAVVVHRTEEDGLWYCSIGLPDDEGVSYEAAASSDTAPRAICLAALKAIGDSHAPR